MKLKATFRAENRNYCKFIQGEQHIIKKFVIQEKKKKQEQARRWIGGIYNDISMSHKYIKSKEDSFSGESHTWV